jgi:hypothetical protein
MAEFVKVVSMNEIAPGQARLGREGRLSGCDAAS